MNKILLVEDKKIRGGEYRFETKRDVSIKIEQDVIIHDINNKNNLNLEIENNSKLELYQIKELNGDYVIKITLLDEAKFNYHMLVLNKDKHKVIIDVNMLGNNSQADIDVRAINKNDYDNLDIICNGYIKKDTSGNELAENLKGLITYENASIKISPNMLVDTNEVKANHLVTIGTIDEEELFYLQTRGLKKETAKNILIEAFIKHGMQKLELDYLNMGGEKNE